MKADAIARQAADLVGGERDRTHGAKRKNFANIAAMWNAYIGARFEGHIGKVILQPRDVGLMMAAMKIARTCSGAHNADDYTDCIGYAACAGELAEEDAQLADHINAETAAKSAKLPVKPYE